MLPEPFVFELLLRFVNWVDFSATDPSMGVLDFKFPLEWRTVFAPEGIKEGPAMTDVPILDAC